MYNFYKIDIISVMKKNKIIKAILFCFVLATIFTGNKNFSISLADFSLFVPRLADAAGPYVYPYQAVGTDCQCGFQSHRGGWFNGIVNGIMANFKYNMLPAMPGSIRIEQGFSNTNTAGARTNRLDDINAISWKNDLHVNAVSGVDTNSGTVTAPLATTQKAFDLAQAGTRIIVHQGTYDHGASVKDALPNFPILVIAANKLSNWDYESQPVLGTGGRGLTLKHDYYIVDGFRFIDASPSAMLQVETNQKPKGIVIQNNLFKAEQETVTSYGIIGNPLIIRNNTFENNIKDAIRINSDGFTFVYNNKFLNSGPRMACMGGCVFMNNIIQGKILESYLTDNTLVINNLDYDYCSGTDGKGMLYNERTSNMFSSNNTGITAVTGCNSVSMHMKSTGTLMQNNLVANNSKGIHEWPLHYVENSPFGEKIDNQYKYNFFYNVSKLFSTTQLTGKGSVVTDLASPNNSAFLGQFSTNINSSVNPIGSNYFPKAGSAIINAGSSDTPVPVGGGLRADIGAFESGANTWASNNGADWQINGVYDYQPKLIISDNMPTFVWDFTDHDNDYAYSAGQVQYSFKAQIDIVPTFDSANLIDSGEVVSSVSKWTVPVSLSSGKYYFRVITSDNMEPGVFGAWSDPRWAFGYSLSGFGGSTSSQTSSGTGSNTTNSSGIVGYPDGALLRVSGDVDIYIVKLVGNKKFKRLILNPQVFDSYSHLRWEDVITVNKATIDSYVVSNLVQEIYDTKVYKLIPNGDIGTKQWLNISASAFESKGFDWDSIYTVNKIDINNYITGPSISS